MHRVYLAFLCFFRVLFGKPLPEELAPATPVKQLEAAAQTAAPVVEKVVEKVVERVVEQAKPSGDGTRDGALQLLALLQREGRLVDFLRESIDSYDDADIGAAVRDIHRGCRKAIDEHFALEPVLPGAENERVTVAAGFDPARIRLVGDVKGQPPFAGTLRHHGWNVVKVKLPQTTGGMDHAIVAPAEVELG